MKFTNCKARRAVIAEDSAALRYALREILEHYCHIVAEAENGEEAVKLVEEHRPEFVLLDISMPVLNGFEAASQIRSRWPEAKIIFVSSHADDAYIERAFQSGAQGYVFKHLAPLQLPQAIEQVFHGHQFRPAASTEA